MLQDLHLFQKFSIDFKHDYDLTIKTVKIESYPPRVGKQNLLFSANLTEAFNLKRNIHEKRHYHWLRGDWGNACL